MDEFSYVDAFLSGTSRLRSLTLRINAKKTPAYSKPSD